MMMPIKSPCEQSAAHVRSGSVQPCRGPWVLIATILASSMAFIDGTVVNVALPALQADLHASVSDIQWVVEAYALLLASLLLLGGSLGDLYGRRKVFLFRSAGVCSWIVVVRSVFLHRFPRRRTARTSREWEQHSWSREV